MDTQNSQGHRASGIGHRRIKEDILPPAACRLPSKSYSLCPMPYALLVIVLLLNGGCKTLQTVVFGTKPAAKLPIVFTTTPTLGQVKEEFNKRYAGIQSLSTSTATFSMSSVLITMKSCKIAYEKPKKLRVLGGITGMGTEFDLGSNDELFWFWAKRLEPKAVYYARHDEFANSPSRSIIPIEPEWLIETLGIIELKETDTHEEPKRDEEGNLQVTSYLKTPRGVYPRMITFNPQTGAILKYAIYAPNGLPFVGAILSNHEVDPVTGILYAKKIVITCPEANETITINMGSVSFNSSGGFSPDAFVMPSYKDYIPVDMCSPEYRQQFAPGQQLSPVFPPTTNYPGPAYREEEIAGTTAHSSVFVRPR